MNREQLISTVKCRCRTNTWAPDHYPVAVFTPGHYEVQHHHPDCQSSKDQAFRDAQPPQPPAAAPWWWPAARAVIDALVPRRPR